MAVLLLSVLFILQSPVGTGSDHPVPLAANVDASKCVECHGDKTQGKVVHAAVQAGCLSCHFVRNSSRGTRIVPKNSRTQTLCGNCHEDKKLAPSNHPVHPPQTDDCLKCHLPHTSTNASLLRKETSGDKNANLCLECHTKGENVSEKGSRHAALDMGCATCHTTHKSGEIGKQDAEFHLTKATPGLCLDCHDVKDSGLIEAHSKQPLAGADCIQCHDPHQSTSTKLLQANLHSPFEAKLCDTCHAPAKDGKVALTQPDARAVCLACHKETGKKIESAKTPHAGAQGDCTQCHDPHAGRVARFLKPDAVGACLTCHTDLAEARTSKAVLHDPVFEQGCNICHTAHGGERPHLLRTEIDDLCLECHASGAKAGKPSEGAGETIFGGAVRLPAGYIEKAKRIEVSRQGLGHPVFGHPIRGADPRDKTKQITCVTCHDPHAGGKRLIVAEAASSRALCKLCHKEM